MIYLFYFLFFICWFASYCFTIHLYAATLLTQRGCSSKIYAATANIEFGSIKTRRVPLQIQIVIP